MRIKNQKKNYYKPRKRLGFHLFSISEESKTEKSLRWILVVSILSLIIALIAILAIGIASRQSSASNDLPTTEETPKSSPVLTSTYYVTRVIDGDTIKINYDGKETSVRLIGVNTPETVDPRTTVECFGQEASNYLKNLLTGKTITMESDSSQTDRDKYDRLLRYVYLDGEDVGYKVINAGYGHEYTYNIPYAKQESYKEAQKDAERNGRGLWADDVCSGEEKSSNDNNNSANCNIKGNINSRGEKIYHMPGQKYYDSTVINVSAGERWFCSEAEAQAAGWRKSKV